MLFRSNPRFQKALGAEQDRLTQALADLVSQAQTKGFADPALDPHSVAVFIQAYTLGRAVDEISDSEKNHEAWNHLIDLVVDKVEHQVAKIKDKRVKRSHPRGRLHHNGLGEVIPIDVSFDHEDDAKFVKSKQFVTTPMGPEEAAVQMDLLGHDFYLYQYQHPNPSLHHLLYHRLHP